MEYITEVQVKVFEAHKAFVKECYKEWEDFIVVHSRQEIEERYPDGFKDYLLEKIQNHIGALISDTKKTQAIAE